MTNINWNKFNLVIGDKVIVDVEHPNSSEVTIMDFTPNKMFAMVKAEDGYQWQTMTSRLSPIYSPIKEIN